MKKIDEKIIEDSVRIAEKTTSGEIVPMLVKASDLYPAAHFRSAIAFSIIFGLLAYYSPLNFDDPIILLWIQVPGLIFGYLLSYIPTVKRFFITSREIEEEVDQRAIQAFFENNLHFTRDRSGILIFVSLLEHKAKIIADSGVDKQVKDGIWDDILLKLTEKIRKGDLTEGFVQAISSCGDILSTHFPIKRDDTNELSNKLIIE